MISTRAPLRGPVDLEEVTRVGRVIPLVLYGICRTLDERQRDGEHEDVRMGMHGSRLQGGMAQSPDENLGRPNVASEHHIEKYQTAHFPFPDGRRSTSLRNE
jgi:hypothetical protein